MLDLKRLRYFIAVADAGGFGRAAERLHMSQPPLSRRIQELEAMLGARLIDRGARPQALTEAGRLLLEEGRPILQRVDQLEQSMRRFLASDQPSLSIGAPRSAFPLRLPEIIQRFRALHPQARLTLSELTSLEQVQALKERRIDVSFGRVRVEDLAIQRSVLLEEPLLAVLPATHRLAARPRVALEDLAAETLALFPKDERPGFGDHILSLLHDRGLTPGGLVEVHDLHTALILVASGEAACLAPEAAALFSHPGVVFRPLQDAVSSPLILSYRAGDAGPALQAFIGVAEAVLRSSDAGNPPDPSVEVTE